MSWAFEQIFSLPVIHYLVTRYAPNNIKRLAFEEKLNRGTWDYAISDKSKELLDAIQEYSAKGNILCLGCGGGSLAAALRSDSFEMFVGVDLSRKAIARAKERENGKIKFHLGDMRHVAFDLTYTVIIFEESLFYVPAFQRLGMLRRYRGRLANNGVFIVTTYNHNRFERMFSMIKRNFTVLEGRHFQDSLRYLCIFK